MNPYRCINALCRPTRAGDRRPPIAFSAMALAAVLLASPLSASERAEAQSTRIAAAEQAKRPAQSTAPQFTERAASAWINSAPLSIESFRGKVLLIDVWTFECWNCYRSFPWLKDLEARLEPRGLAVLGIHSPEFDRERERKRVEAKVREFGIEHPVMLDNDFAYWNALGNRYWPAFYVVDKNGVIRGRFAGETHIGDRRARQIESLIATLLAE